MNSRQVVSLLMLALAISGCRAAPAPTPTGPADNEMDLSHMKKAEDSVAVNDPSRPDLPVLNRHQVWQGLVMKAEDATRFVPIITHCKVIERFEGGLIREINVGEQRVRERVTFLPEQRVRFVQLDGPAKGGAVDNIIDEDKDGTLRLRFVFYVPPGGSLDGLGSKDGAPTDLKAIYRQALESTLATVRKLARQ